jgi:hypothetical protein
MEFVLFVFISVEQHSYTSGDVCMQIPAYLWRERGYPHSFQYQDEIPAHLWRERGYPHSFQYQDEIPAHLWRERGYLQLPVPGRDTKLRPVTSHIHTHQHEAPHSWLEVFAGGGGPQDVFHHLDTQTPRFRGTRRQDVGRLAAREAA